MKVQVLARDLRARPCGHAATGSTAEPMLSTDVSAVAIEVIEYEDANNVAVLLSTLRDAKSPEQLECRIGFANGAQASNTWRDRGFPLVDAAIVREGDVLRVGSPFFAPPPRKCSTKRTS